MKSLFRMRKTGIVAVLFVAIVSALAAQSLLSTVTALRMVELRDSLNAASESKTDVRNIALLSRIQLISRSALAGGRENSAAYKAEAETALLAIRGDQSERAISWRDRIALPFLNTFNRVLGLPRLKLGKTPAKDLVLDLAYRYESMREYANAQKGYTAYLSGFSLTQDQRDFAALHRGFAEAMLNRFDASLLDFNQVTQSPLVENADTARKLSLFVSALREKIARIEAITDPEKRGILYYEAAAYLKALENFALLGSSSQSAKVRFYMARSYEETGQKNKAIQMYRELVKNDHQSVYAVNANRRMYLLGTFLGNDHSLTEESKSNSKTVVKDTEFIGSISHLEESAKELHREQAERAEESKSVALKHELVLPPSTPPMKVEQASMPSEKSGSSTEAPKKTEKTKPPVVATPRRELPVKPLPAPKIVKPVDTEIVVDLSDENQAEEASDLDATAREKLLKKQKKPIDKITLRDSNTFIGAVYKEDNETVYIYSTMGNLPISKNLIVQREKIVASKIGSSE